MRRLAISSLALLAACASGGASASSPDQQTIRVSGSSGSSTFNLRNNTSVDVARVAYPIDKVWRVMPAVFDSLKIPLTTADGSKHTIGNDGMKVRSKLGGVALSKYIDCGQAQIGPSADTYDVFLTVLTTVRAVSTTETELQTTVESAARPITFNQEYSRCSTKGKLETTISDIVSAKLAGGK
jgi:hypothetical protein